MAFWQIALLAHVLGSLVVLAVLGAAAVSAAVNRRRL